MAHPSMLTTLDAPEQPLRSFGLGTNGSATVDDDLAAHAGDVVSGVAGVDIVYTDVWVSTMSRPIPGTSGSDL